MIIQDISLSDVLKTTYDLAFFSCGYEQRCIAFHRSFTSLQVEKEIIFHFKSHKNKENRIRNESYYRKFENTNIELNFDAQKEIYNILNNYASENSKSSYRLLVDYSSMSRLWYSAILNWGYFYNRKIEIDLVYNIGKYKNVSSPLTINGILSIPGCEGDTSKNKTISIFGLGSDKISTLFVLDRIEPDIVYSMIAESQVNKKLQKITTQINEEFIKNYSKPVIYYPLESIWKMYLYLKELIIPFKDKYNVSLVPMGPKPNVLASLLLSIADKSIICLYVKGDRKDPTDVIPSDTYICTKICFEIINEGKI